MPIFATRVKFLSRLHLPLWLQVLVNLSRVTKISNDDILDLATILVQQVLCGNEQ